MKYENYDDEAKEELKRADHLLFVTLKYTRTVDVIRNTIKRLINAFDFEILNALECAKKKKKLKTIHLLPKVRAEVLVKLIRNERILELIRFYFFLRKIERLDVTGRDEYRKDVTMVVWLDEVKKIDIDTKTLKEYYDNTRCFVELVDEWIDGLK